MNAAGAELAGSTSDNSSPRVFLQWKYLYLWNIIIHRSEIGLPYLYMPMSPNAQPASVNPSTTYCKRNGESDLRFAHYFGWPNLTTFAFHHSITCIIHIRFTNNITHSNVLSLECGNIVVLEESSDLQSTITPSFTQSILSTYRIPRVFSLEMLNVPWDVVQCRQMGLWWDGVL